MNPAGWAIGLGVGAFLGTVPALIAAIVLLTLVLSRRRGRATYVVFVLSLVYVVVNALTWDDWKDASFGEIGLTFFLYFGYGVIIFGALAVIVVLAMKLMKACSRLVSKGNTNDVT